MTLLQQSPATATHHKPSREEIAKAEIGYTDSTPGVNRFLVVFFLAVIAAVPLWRNFVEIRAIRSGGQVGRSVPQSWDPVFFLLPSRQELSAFHRAGSLGDKFDACRATNARMLRDISDYERQLKDNDGMVRWLIPRMQTVITGWLRGGNEDAYCGRDGWLFYRRDIESLTARPFLDPRVLAQRAGGGDENNLPPQPDPVRAIVDFRDQLARRGITLVVMPTPVKPSIYPERFSARYEGRATVVQNPSYQTFLGRLAQAGVTVFDPALLLAQARAESSDPPLYLKTDTHWTPQAMEWTAEKLAGRVRELVSLPAAQAGRFATLEKTVENLGDVARMLRLPDDQGIFPPEQVRIRQVLDGKGFWRPDPKAQVLFLGDSFANIYSLEPMGWGESAGLVEHLSRELGLGVDAICRNDAGSHATRDMLARELRRGHDRLAGKKIVIWEFATRELSWGDWKLLPLVVSQKKPSGFFVPAAGQSVEVQGVVRATSAVPRPGSVPYKDHIFTIHLTDIQSGQQPSVAGKEAVVFAWSMRDNHATPACRYRPGDTIRLRLRAWSGVAAQYEAINRSELDDEDLLLAEPAWAEAVEPQN